MTGIPPDLLRTRLDALYLDLAESSAEGECPPQIARVFNALLAESRDQLDRDPVLRAISALRPQGEGGTLPSIRTVRTLVGQLRAAFPEAGSGSRGEESRRTAADAGN